MSDTLDNPRIQELLSRFGAPAYLWYFGTLEFLAREDALLEPAEVSIKFLARKFHTKPEQLLTFYRDSADLLTTSYSTETEKISLFCKKMQQIKDNYHKDLQGSCKKLGYKSKEVEVDKEIDKEPKPLTAKEPPSFNAVKYFFDKYLEYRQVKYVMTDNKAEAGILTTLCKKTGEDEYKRAIEAFHKSTDKFHTGGWTSYNLAKHINIWLAVVIDPNADNRIFLVKNNHYYVLNEGNDSMMYVKEEWEKDIVKFENKNGKKAVIRYE